MADKDFRVKLGLHVGANAYIEGNITSVDSIQMNVASPTAVGGAGQLAWNIDENTIDVGMNANTTLQLGQEQYYYVKNQTGSLIPDGTVVMANGTVGASGRIKVSPALANGTFPSKYIIGITTEDIPDGGDGFVTAFGKVRGLDTSMFNEGDILYANPAVAGGLANTVPVAPNNIVTVAIVVNKHATNGTLFVRPTYGSNLLENEALHVEGVTDGQALVYVTANSRFENKTISAGGGDASNSWVNANDAATILSAYSNDASTLLTARSNDGSTLLSAYSNDASTLLTARSNDGSTLLSAYANDAALYSSIRSFNAFVVAGQSDVVANGFTSTLTLAAGNGMSITTNASTDTITISSIGPRLVYLADATSITVNVDTTDVAQQNNTQAVGTLTVNAPTGTITDSEKFILRIRSANVQTFSWNAVFAGSTDGSLPTATTGSSKTDYMGFMYMTADSKWHMIAKNFGF